MKIYVMMDKMYKFTNKYVELVSDIEIIETELKSKRRPRVVYYPKELSFETGQRGSKLLNVDGFTFVKNRLTEGKTYWICSKKVRTFKLLFDR